MLLQLLGAALAVYFRHDDQILTVRRDSSGWVSLSVVPISYVKGGWLFVFVVFGIQLDCFSSFSESVASCNLECKIRSFPFEPYTLCIMSCCGFILTYPDGSSDELRA